MTLSMLIYNYLVFYNYLAFDDFQIIPVRKRAEKTER